MPVLASNPIFDELLAPEQRFTRWDPGALADRIRTLAAPASRGKIINLGSGRSRSINELAASVTAAFGGPPSQPATVRAVGRPGEQRSVCADIGLAKALLGWEPMTPFEIGLAKTVQWAREQFSAARAASSGDAQ